MFLDAEKSNKLAKIDFLLEVDLFWSVALIQVSPFLLEQ